MTLIQNAILPLSKDNHHQYKIKCLSLLPSKRKKKLLLNVMEQNGGKKAKETTTTSFERVREQW